MNFIFVQEESAKKRIFRFFRNDKFNIELFYHKFILFVVNKYKPKHKRIHISLDHMFSNDDFTVLFFSMRIGKQGIPLWFKCFKGKHKNDAYKTDLIKDGIKYVSDLFFNTDCELIFLADRWFSNINIMDFIDSLGHTYCIRIRKNFLAYFKKPFRKRLVPNMLNEITHLADRSKYFYNIKFTNDEYITTLVFGKRSGTKDPWIIATNGKAENAIRDYSYRHGSIETIFKNQKTNGFRLESTNFKNVKAFECDVWNFKFCTDLDDYIGC